MQGTPFLNSKQTFFFRGNPRVQSGGDITKKWRISVAWITGGYFLDASSAGDVFWADIL